MLQWFKLSNNYPWTPELLNWSTHKTFSFCHLSAHLVLPFSFIQHSSSSTGVSCLSSSPIHLALRIIVWSGEVFLTWWDPQSISQRFPKLKLFLFNLWSFASLPTLSPHFKLNPEKITDIQHFWPKNGLLMWAVISWVNLGNKTASRNPEWSKWQLIVKFNPENNSSWSLTY